MTTFCDFERIAGTGDYQCRRDGCRRIVQNVRSLPVWAACAVQEGESEQATGGTPGCGPGTELRAMLAKLGIVEQPNCDCEARAIQMDMWGPRGCRKNLQLIVGWMREGAPRWGWADKLKAAALAAATGLAFNLNPLDPFPGIVEEAIRRAESSQRCKNRASPQ